MQIMPSLAKVMACNLSGANLFTHHHNRCRLIVCERTSVNVIKMRRLSIKKTYLKMSSVKWPTGCNQLLPHGLNCRPGPCEGVAGAMWASRVACKVVWFIVKQRQLHASPPANELSWLLEPKFLATPAIGNSQSRVEVNLPRRRGFEV